MTLRNITPLLQVYDMPTSIRFYRDILGFTIAGNSAPMGQDSFHWAFLRHGDAELMLNTAYEFNEQRPVPADAARTAAHGDTGLFISCPDVDAAYGELRARIGGLKAPKVAPYGMKQFWVRDPDGYTLCFQSPANSTSSTE